MDDLLSDSLRFRDDTRYAYAVGRVRAMERGLLMRDDFARMMEARDVDEVWNVLTERGYRRDAEEFEDALREEWARHMGQISEISENRAITDLFRVQHDFHNLKMLLKSRYAGEEHPHGTVDLGTIPVSTISEALSGENGSAMPPFLREAMADADAEYAETEDPVALDAAVDRRRFARFLSVLRGNPFLEGWIEREIDLSNIYAFLRVHRMGMGSGNVSLRYAWIDGGSLAFAFFRDMLDETLDGLPRRFSRTRYATFVSRSVELIQDGDAFSRVERLRDGVVRTYMRHSAHVCFGIEPLIAYLVCRRIELDAVRTVLVGKINRVPPETIRERLPDVYA